MVMLMIMTYLDILLLRVRALQCRAVQCSGKYVWPVGKNGTHNDFFNYARSRQLSNYNGSELRSAGYKDDYDGGHTASRSKDMFRACVRIDFRPGLNSMRCYQTTSQSHVKSMALDQDWSPPRSPGQIAQPHITLSGTLPQR